MYIGESLNGLSRFHIYVYIYIYEIYIHMYVTIIIIKEERRGHKLERQLGTGKELEGGKEGVSTR